MIGAVFLLSAMSTAPVIPRMTVCRAQLWKSAGDLVEVAGVVRKGPDGVELRDSRCPNFAIVLDFASSDDQPWVSFSSRSCPGKELVALVRGRLNNRMP